MFAFWRLTNYDLFLSSLELHNLESVKTVHFSISHVSFLRKLNFILDYSQLTTLRWSQADSEGTQPHIYESLRWTVWEPWSLTRKLSLRRGRLDAPGTSEWQSLSNGRRSGTASGTGVRSARGAPPAGPWRMLPVGSKLLIGEHRPPRLGASPGPGPTACALETGWREACHPPTIKLLIGILVCWATASPRFEKRKNVSLRGHHLEARQIHGFINIA